MEANKAKIQTIFEEKRPENYKTIVTAVISGIQQEAANWDKFEPDPDRIHEIDDGDYQGTLLYVIAKKGYQPS